MYLETMQQIYNSTSKVMVDAKSGSNMLYLPLDKLIGQQGETRPAPTGTVSVQSPQEVMQTVEHVNRNNRSRESSRDREGR
jgi:membrane protease subunit HflK